MPLTWSTDTAGMSVDGTGTASCLVLRFFISVIMAVMGLAGTGTLTDIWLLSNEEMYPMLATLLLGDPPNVGVVDFSVNK